MSRQLHQSQYILQKCFDNKQNVIRVSMNNAQDYLNAIYDASKDALRVNMVGGMLPVVDDPTGLPSYAADSQICPVYNAENDVIDFYEWSEALGEWVYRGSTISGNALEGDEKQAVEWVTEHLDQLKEVADYNYIVNVADVHLDPNNRVVEVQGQRQDIDDDLDGDSDDTTPYRIDFSGYVLSISTYADNSALIPDKYYTKITYESGTGGLGTSHIFLQQEEFDYFASLQEGKNIIRVYYLTNATSTPIRKKRLTLNPDGTATDEEGENYVISDSGDTDGDASTPYCIDIAGYVLGTETFAGNDALAPDKCYMKINYESDGVYSGRSHIYMDSNEFEECSQLGNGKNIIDIYYLQKVFPASVTVSEIQYMFPSDSVDYVAMDASGNIKNILDHPDKDGDESTHVRITVNGYAIDMDGYYNDNDPIKHRLIVKMNYNHESDTTDIYLEREHYDYVATLRNGRNVVSIYTVGAGLGVDASRIPTTAKVHIWKGTKASVAELQQVENPENGDTWQVGDREYSWNGYEWVELGSNSGGASTETPISHLTSQTLTATAGGCYKWTIQDGVESATVTLNATQGTRSVTYVDVECLGSTVLYGTNVVVDDQPDPGTVTRFAIEFDGTTARMRSLEDLHGIEDEITLPSNRATQILVPGRSYILSLDLDTTILIDDMVKSVGGQDVDMLEGKCADIRLHLSTNENSVEWKTVSEKDEEEQTKIHLATALEKGFSYLMVLRLSGGKWNVCALEL
jgi:hypothetical protein